MADQVQLSGPIHIVDGSKERVAYDLMLKISAVERGLGPERDRDYYLNLYAECYRAVVYGWDLKTTRENLKQP